MSRRLRYLSLFSGIGGFEAGIHKVFPDAVCIGFSEIKPAAIKVYKHHFPSHENLGDIAKITEEKLREICNNGCDLIVAGFPCTNLSSLANATDIRSGLHGSKSGLFYELLRIIQLLPNNIDIVIENNVSMGKTNRDLITDLLRQHVWKKIYINTVDNSKFGVQIRKRIFWTTFRLEKNHEKCIQSWDNILEDMRVVRPLKMTDKAVNYMNQSYGSHMRKNVCISIPSERDNSYNIFTSKKGEYIDTRWYKSLISDTTSIENTYYKYPTGKSRPIVAPRTTTCALVDRRFGKDDEFIIRKFTCIELERLFGFTDNWTDVSISSQARGDLLANAVSVLVSDYIMVCFKS